MPVLSAEVNQETYNLIQQLKAAKSKGAVRWSASKYLGPIIERAVARDPDVMAMKKG